MKEYSEETSEFVTPKESQQNKGKVLIEKRIKNLLGCQIYAELVDIHENILEISNGKRYNLHILYKDDAVKLCVHPKDLKTNGITMHRYDSENKCFILQSGSLSFRVYQDILELDVNPMVEDTETSTGYIYLFSNNTVVMVWDKIKGEITVKIKEYSYGAMLANKLI